MKARYKVCINNINSPCVDGYYSNSDFLRLVLKEINGNHKFSQIAAQGLHGMK